MKGERDPWLVTATIVLSVLGLLSLSWWIRGLLLDRRQGDDPGDARSEGQPPQS